MYHSSNSSNNSSRSILTVKYEKLVYFDITYKNNRLAIRVEKKKKHKRDGESGKNCLLYKDIL